MLCLCNSSGDAGAFDFQPFCAVGELTCLSGLPLLPLLQVMKAVLLKKHLYEPLVPS